MITANRTEWLCNAAAPYIRWRIHKAFNRLKIEPVDVVPNHSVLYLCNHFSWWDGFLAGYVAHFTLKKHFHIMMQEDQIQSRKILRRLGAYSLPKGSREMITSLNYTAELLNDEQNLVTLFPQGALRSNHMENIGVEKGIGRIIQQVKNPCQVIYASVLIDYFESIKPSAYIRLHHCGTSLDLDINQLSSNIQSFHRQDLDKQRSLL